MMNFGRTKPVLHWKKFETNNHRTSLKGHFSATYKVSLFNTTGIQPASCKIDAFTFYSHLWNKTYYAGTRGHFASGTLINIIFRSGEMSFITIQ